MVSLLRLIVIHTSNNGNDSAMEVRYGRLYPQCCSGNTCYLLKHHSSARKGGIWRTHLLEMLMLRTKCEAEEILTLSNLAQSLCCLAALQTPLLT